MKMKKFLIIYFIFVFSLFILYAALRMEEAGAQKQANVVNKSQRKNIFIIFTDKFEPVGRVIAQSLNGTMIYDWKNAIVNAKEIIKFLFSMINGHTKCEHF